MKIADLFVDLGIKGADKSRKDLRGVEGALDSAYTKSLALKAGIAGVVYGLERLTGSASQWGMDLHKFTVTTGLSAQELQKWQFAAMKFDVSGEEMQGTIRGINQAIADMRLGKGAPEAMGLVGIDTKKADDTFYVLSKIQDFAKKQPPAMAASVLKSFGISDNVFQFLKTARPEDFNIGSRLINAKDIDNLRKVNVAWKEFWFDLKLTGTRLVASDEFGELFGEIKNDVMSVIGVVQKFLSFLREIGALKPVMVALGVAIAAAFGPITGIIAGIAAIIPTIKKYAEGEGILGFSSETVRGFKDVLGAPGDFLGKIMSERETASVVGGGFTPSYAAAEKTQQVNMNLTNTFNVNGNIDRENREELTRSFENAARQLPRSVR